MHLRPELDREQELGHENVIVSDQAFLPEATGVVVLELEMCWMCNSPSKINYLTAIDAEMIPAYKY